MAELLKDRYNKMFIDNLSKDFVSAYPKFDSKQFSKLVFNKQWTNFELKERLGHITQCVHKVLALPYSKAIPILKKVIKMRSGLGLEYMFFPDYTERYGRDHLKLSLNALAAFTEYASSEFAIRPFILNYEKETMAQLEKWATHKNHHIRRLASEGCRPRLPWAMALPKYKKDPKPVIKILEMLKADPSEYVRKSVANNLNDISKDHPEQVLKIAKKWKGKNEQTNWITKHACRTLLKQGNTDAMVLFGFVDPKAISIKRLKLQNPTIRIGEDLFFDFEIVQSKNQNSFLRLEYIIDFVKKTGKNSKKIFKISENTYKTASTIIQRKQSFKDLSTRKHYPGKHRLAIVVNGVEKAFAHFEVLK